MIKVLEDLDITPLLECYKNLEDNIQWSEFPTGKQVGIQHRKDCDPWSDAVGQPDSRGWKEEMFINQFFKNTPFEYYINKYKIRRTRLMWIKPHSCYSMHRDYTPRLHIPIITNPDCYFVFKKEGLFNMPVGHIYWVDTTKEHSAMNCSNEWRLHLLGIAAL